MWDREFGGFYNLVNREGEPIEEGPEIINPARTLPRAGWIASGFATVFYSATTVAMLVLLRPEKISELNGLAEAGESAGLALGALWLPPLMAVLVMASPRWGIRRFRRLGLPPAFRRRGGPPAAAGPSRACIQGGERRTFPSSRSARWRPSCC